MKISVNILLFSFIFQISQVFSDPNILETFKGLGSVTFDEKYNPINGALAEAYLKGERYFGAYGENKEELNSLFKCIVKNRINPQNSTPLPDNCPQDAVTALIQWLFPNPTMDGNFAPNRRGSQFKDLVATFGSVTIGRILNEILMAKGTYDQKLAKDIEKAILEEYKKTLLSMPQISPSEKKLDVVQIRKEYEEKFGNLPVNNNFPTFESVVQFLENQKKLSKKQKKNQQNSVKPSTEQMNLANTYNNIINPTIQKIKSSSPKQQKTDIEKTYIDQAELLGKIIVAALQQVSNQKTSLQNPLSFEIEEKIENQNQEISPNKPELTNFSQQEIYHPDIITMALLHFAWTISKDKSDIVTLLKAMPAVVDQQQLDNYIKTDDYYTEKEYLELKDKITKLNPFEHSKIFSGSNGLELAGILGFGYQYFDLKFPKKIGYTSIPLFKDKYDSNNPQQERYTLSGGASLQQGEIPDCGESSLRTVLMFLLFDPSKNNFNIESFIQNAKSKNLIIHEKLIDFFKTYSSPASAKTYGARADWMRTTSFLENDISYVKKAGLQGKFTDTPVCEINAGVENMMKVLSVFLGLSTKSIQENFIDMTPLDTLLGLISTNENKWKWKTSDGKEKISKNIDKNIRINFYQNNKLIFTWIFMLGHFDSVVHLPQEVNWLQTTGENLLQSKEFLPVYFPLLVDESFIPKNIKELKLSPENKSLLLYSRDLQDVNNRLKLIEHIAEDDLISFIDFGKRLIYSLKELALNDMNTTKSLIRITAKSEILANYFADIIGMKGDEKLDYNTAFDFACISGNLALAKRWIENINFTVEKDENNEDILFETARLGLLPTLEFLLNNEKTAQSLLKQENIKNVSDSTPLHTAVYYDKFSAINALLKNQKAQQILLKQENIRNRSKESPLDIAVNEKFISSIRTLLNNQEACKILLSDENIYKNNIHDTYLYLAAPQGDLDVVEAFLSNHEALNILLNEKNVKNNLSNTALHVASHKGNASIVKAFLDNSEARKILLSKNNIDSNQGNNPLYLAVKGRHLSVVKVLLENSEARDILYHLRNTKNKDNKSLYELESSEEIQNYIKEIFGNLNY